MINENNVIQKSTLLLDELKSSKLTMQELKCIEVYLSKINSHRPEQHKVTFEKDVGSFQKTRNTALCFPTPTIP